MLGATAEVKLAMAVVATTSAASFGTQSPRRAGRSSLGGRWNPSRHAPVSRCAPVKSRQSFAISQLPRNPIA